MAIPSDAADAPVFFHKPDPDPPSYRNFPWKLRHVLIGVVPFFIIGAILYPLRSHLPALPRWGFMVVSYTSGAWMLASTLIATRRLPALPSLRTVFGNFLLSLPLLVFALFSMAAISLVSQRLTGEAVGEGPYFDVVGVSSSRLQSYFMLFLGVVVAPLTEEPFHRGMIYNAFRQRMPWGVAAILESILFALFHPYSLADRVSVFAGGLILVGFYEWRKTLAAPIAFHAVMNAYSVSVSLMMGAAMANAPIIGVSVDPGTDGCHVSHIMPGGPAEEAGIRVGDLIPEMDVYSVRKIQHIVSIMQMHKPGDMISVKYIRDGEEFTVQVTLKERPK